MSYSQSSNSASFRMFLCVGAAMALAAPSLGQFERTLGVSVPTEHFSLTRVVGPDGFLSGGYRINPADAMRKIHLVRWGPSGEVLWERIGVQPERSEVHSVAQASNGDLLVAGETNAVPGPVNIFFMRLDPAGNVIWSRVMSGTAFLDTRRCVTVIEAPDTTLLITGRQAVVGALGHMGRIARFSPAGAPLWNFTYTDAMSPATGQVIFTDVRVANDGTIWVAGDRRAAPGAPRQATLFHVTPAGGPIVAFLYNPPTVDRTGDSLDYRPATNEFVIGGRVIGAAGGPPQLKLIKTNGGGVPIWNLLHNYGNFSFEIGHTAALFMPTGNIQVAGTGFAGPLERATWQVFGAGGGWLAGHWFGLPAETAFCDLDLDASGPAMVGFYENGPFAFGARAAYLARADATGDTGCKNQDFKPVTASEPFFTQTNYTPGAATQANFSGLTITDSKRDYPCPPCYPDCDMDGVLSIADFICFQTMFAVSDPYADCDGDGALSVNDFICFQTFFAIGC